MIKFGTDGWRAVISEKFTFENVQIVAQAIADYIKNEDDPLQGLVIGYDSRFLSDKYAELCAEVVSANGIKVYLTEKITPTPVVSYAVKYLETAGGIMVTASHNPAEYNGIKFKAAYGGSALPSMIEKIEGYLHKNPVQKISVTEAKEKELIEYINADEPYFKHLQSIIDLESIRSFKPKVIVDPIYGAGSGYIERFLEQEGIEVTQIRNEFNPSFCGVNPEPIDKNLKPLKEAVLENNAQIGVATDGDADRVGAVDVNGDFINSHQIYALMFRHLVEKKKWQGGVVKTFSTSQMIDKLADKYQVQVFQTPIGFKYICELFLNEDILIGGEESGGIGIKNHLPERDGILCSLLLLEIMAVHQKTIGEVLNELMAEIGQHYYDRIDLHITNEQKEKVMQELKKNPPQEFARLEVKEVQTLDGVKLYFHGRQWILFRPSGTEPVVRVYAEAFSIETVNELLEAGRNLVLG